MDVFADLMRETYAAAAAAESVTLIPPYFPQEF